jgi:thioredoxin 1
MAVTYSSAVTDADFAREVEQHDGVTMVDFWAAWCGPCHMVAPIVEEIAEEYDGRVKVAKLDVDANQNTAMRFAVRSIPSILLFKNGQHVDTMVGVVPKAHIVEKIEQHLG